MIWTTVQRVNRISNCITVIMVDVAISPRAIHLSLPACCNDCIMSGFRIGLDPHHYKTSQNGSEAQTGYVGLEKGGEYCDSIRGIKNCFLLTVLATRPGGKMENRSIYSPDNQRAVLQPLWNKD